MGRKPNPLILEFFERGQKLEDASNRYQHTCRACGEKFPKGRIDSLTVHLVKKCPAISSTARQRALRQLHDFREFHGADSLGEGSHRSMPERSTGAASAAPGPGASAAEYGLTPLETLAEVSRQIDLSEKHTPTPQDAAGKTERLGEDLIHDERINTTAVTPQYDELLTNEPKDIEMLHASATLPPIQARTPPLVSHPLTADIPGLPLTANTIDMTAVPDLVPVAAQAAAQLAREGSKPGVPLEPDLDGALPHVAGSDKFFKARGPRLQPAPTWPPTQHAFPLDPLLLDGASDQDSMPQTAPPDAPSFTYPMISPHPPQRAYTSEFNVSPNHPRQKVRGRFTASRRKEVQMVRKIGACIRCRMLKKPCSGELPCATCRNVESARLWKQPCIRTRIADELKLYSAGLYNILATQEVRRLKEVAHLHQFPGQVEATHHQESRIHAVFSALEGRRSRLGATEAQDIMILDSDGDNLPGKLESYTKKMMGIFIEREPSPYMKPVLKFVHELAESKKDSLLQRVLELWSVNRIFVDLWKDWLIVRKSGADGIDGQFLPIDKETDRGSYDILCLQLRAAAERQAAQISKALLNELERRLLQRTQGGWFETYLATICLLNCIERSSWLFRTWNYEEYQTTWPLDQKPLEFYHQSERFADMLHMLLRIRGLPPKTQESPTSGILLAPANDDTVQRYFESIRISSKTLEERQDATFDPADSRSLELKLCAKLLLPS